MKNLRIIMAAATMMFMFFCGTQASAQSAFKNTGQNISLDVKQITDITAVELLSDAEALDVVSAEYKSLYDVVPTNEAAHAITIAFYEYLTTELVANKSIETALTDGQLELVVISKNYADPNVNLTTIYNEAVALIENN